MAATTVEDRPTAKHVEDRGADACCNTAKLTDEVRAIKSMAEEAIETGKQAADRALREARRRVDEFADLRDGAVEGMKRSPFRTAGVAFSAGVGLGLALWWLARRYSRGSPSTHA
jgi:ElaB/YqjD/DUF883 family membrane-anchored ribosome-binding protein